MAGAAPVAQQGDATRSKRRGGTHRGNVSGPPTRPGPIRKYARVLMHACARTTGASVGRRRPRLWLEVEAEVGLQLVHGVHVAPLGRCVDLLAP